MFHFVARRFSQTCNDHFVPVVFVVFFVFYWELCFDHRTLCYASSGPTGALNLGASGRCCLWSRLPRSRGTLPRGQKSIGVSAEMTENRPPRQDRYRLIGVPPSRDAYYATECLLVRAEGRLQALLAERGPKCVDVWRGGWEVWVAISILMLFDCRANSRLLTCSLCMQEKQRRVDFFPLFYLYKTGQKGFADIFEEKNISFSISRHASDQYTLWSGCTVGCQFAGIHSSEPRGHVWKPGAAEWRLLRRRRLHRSIAGQLCTRRSEHDIKTDRHFTERSPQ